VRRPAAERAWFVRIVTVVSAVAAVFNGAMLVNSAHLFSGFLPRRLELVVLVILGAVTAVLAAAAVARQPSFTAVRAYAITVLCLNWVVVASPKLTDPPPGNYILFGVTVLACDIAAVSMRAWPASAVIAGSLVPLISIRSLDFGLNVGVLDGAVIAIGAVAMRFIVDLVVRTYDRVDEADRSQAAAAARQSAQAVKGAERERWNRLIHDKVLAALLLASRAETHTVRASARELAADALDALNDTVPDAGDALSVALPLAAQSQGVDVHLDIATEGSPPPDVVTAVLGAAEEVYRNVARHAGTTAASTRVRAGDAFVHVEIRDEGVGFRPERVDPDRFGLTRSIPGHLEDVGGEAVVVSEPGHGTTVTLRWPALVARQPEATHDGYVPLPLPWPALPYLWIASGIFILLLVHEGGTPSATVGVAGALTMLGYRAAQFPSRAAGWVASGITLCSIVLLAVSTEPALHADTRYWMAGMTIPLLVNLTLTGRFAPAWALSIVANLCVYVVWGRHGTGYFFTAIEGMAQMVLITSVGSICSMTLRGATLRAREKHRQGAELDSQASAMRERTAERQRRIASLTQEIIPMLTTIAGGEALSKAQRAEASALEMAARDSILAPHVVDDRVAAAAAHARRRGVNVTLWEGPESAQSDVDVDVEVEFERFRQVVVEVLKSAPDHSEVTIRWQPGTADLLATIAVGGVVAPTVRCLVAGIAPGALVDLDEDGLWLEIRSRASQRPGAAERMQPLAVT